MSILTRPDIEQAIRDGRLRISSYVEFAKAWAPYQVEDLHIGPNSIDLHLHPVLKVYRSNYLDSRIENKTTDIVIPEGGYDLEPGRLYLARTVERTYTPHHVPKVEGRSSMGRLGLCIHQTAGFGDVGFDGTWTLELTVVQPLRITPNMRIGQLCLHNISSEVMESQRYGGDDSHSGRYQGQVEATAALGHKEFNGR